jgi:putative oxidoreductase
MNKNLLRLGRALVALIFIVSGFGKITGFAGTRDMMAGAGFPVATLFLIGAIVLEVSGGLALLAGVKTRWAAIALIVFLIPATIIFHAVHITDSAQGQMQMIETLKNLSILGALIYFAGEPATS